MVYLRSCNICKKEFKEEYIIWNASSINKNSHILNNRDILNNRYCHNYFIFYNNPPRIICYQCFCCYDIWDNYNSKDKLNYISNREYGVVNFKKKIHKKKNNSCILCSKKCTTGVYKTLFNIRYLGPLCYNCV